MTKPDDHTRPALDEPHVESEPPADETPVPAEDVATEAEPGAAPEVGGPPGPDPTRFGDWERRGRCIDF